MKINLNEKRCAFVIQEMLLRDIRVFFGLALLADEHGQGEVVFAQVIDASNQSYLSVARALVRLEELKLIRVVWGNRKGPGASFHFTISRHWVETHHGPDPGRDET